MSSISSAAPVRSISASRPSAKPAKVRPGARTGATCRPAHHPDTLGHRDHAPVAHRLRRTFAPRDRIKALLHGPFVAGPERTEDDLAAAVRQPGGVGLAVENPVDGAGRIVHRDRPGKAVAFLQRPCVLPLLLLLVHLVEALASMRFAHIQQDELASVAEARVEPLQHRVGTGDHRAGARDLPPGGDVNQADRVAVGAAAHRFARRHGSEPSVRRDLDAEAAALDRHPRHFRARIAGQRGGQVEDGGVVRAAIGCQQPARTERTDGDAVRVGEAAKVEVR
ncbi:MAG TPA: hypothetical protein VGN83_00025 [Falsiroseomonas sp.]|nr:hypothetical protein [Falsiroseomonas sp.]